MTLSELLSEDRIVLDFKAKNREEALAELVRLVDDDVDRDALLSELQEREELGSTGVGNGVALPHARLDAVQVPTVAFARAQKPVDFGAIDGSPCHLFFLVVAPGDESQQDKYLQTMAKISRIMRDAAAREALSRAGSPAAVLEAVREAEG